MCQKRKVEGGIYGEKNTKWNETRKLQGFLCKNMLCTVNGSGETLRLTENKLAQASEHPSHGHTNQRTAQFILLPRLLVPDLA